MEQYTKDTGKRNTEAFRLGRTAGTLSPCWDPQNFSLLGLEESLLEPEYVASMPETMIASQPGSVNFIAWSSLRSCVNERNPPSLCFSFFSKWDSHQQPCLSQKTVVQISMLENLHFEKLEMPLSQLPTPHRTDKGTFILPRTKNPRYSVKTLT